MFINYTLYIVPWTPSMWSKGQRWPVAEAAHPSPPPGSAC